MSRFLIIAGAVIWIYALVDILQSRFEDNTVKLIWLLVVLFLNVAGALIYLFIGKRQRINY